jgi:Uma2 family endonuclease
MATPTLTTAEQFDALPQEDGRRWELLDGELIEMPTATARQNVIQTRLTMELYPKVVVDGGGGVLTATEFALGENRFQPDLAVLLHEKWINVEQNRVPVLIIPDVAVEIVSPSEFVNKLERRVAIYLKKSVTEVWIINFDLQQMYVHTPDSVRKLWKTDTLETPLLPRWSLPLAGLFAK